MSFVTGRRDGPLKRGARHVPIQRTFSTLDLVVLTVDHFFPINVTLSGVAFVLSTIDTLVALEPNLYCVGSFVWCELETSDMPHHSKQLQREAMAASGYGDSLSSQPSSGNPAPFASTEAPTGMDYLSRASSAMVGSELTMPSSAGSPSMAHSFAPCRPGMTESAPLQHQQQQWHGYNNGHVPHNEMHWTGSSSASSNTLSLTNNDDTPEGNSVNYRGAYHRVPQSPPESATPSANPSDVEGNASSKDDEDDSKSYVRSPSREIASVLLLAVAATSDQELALANQATNGPTDAFLAREPQALSLGKDDASEESVKSSYPFKKRKMFGDLRRKESNEDEETQVHANSATASGASGVCHVSPLSQNSKSSSRSLRTDEDDETPDSARPTMSSLSSRGGGSTARSALEAAPDVVGSQGATTVSHNVPQPPAHVLVPHFPSALHWLLTEASSTTPSSSAQSSTSSTSSPHSLSTADRSATGAAAAAPMVDHTVLQWVSHGQAFRIVRWAAFQAQVLPTYFAHLAMETDNGRTVSGTTGSVDAFLWHLATWGFEEIKDGPDMGAFAHTVRDRHTLCTGPVVNFLIISRLPTRAAVSPGASSIVL
jgi:hypothetical protein